MNHRVPNAFVRLAVANLFLFTACAVEAADSCTDIFDRRYLVMEINSFQIPVKNLLNASNVIVLDRRRDRHFVVSVPKTVNLNDLVTQANIAAMDLSGPAIRVNPDERLGLKEKVVPAILDPDVDADRPSSRCPWNSG